MAVKGSERVNPPSVHIIEERFLGNPLILAGSESDIITVSAANAPAVRRICAAQPLYIECVAVFDEFHKTIHVLSEKD